MSVSNTASPRGTETGRGVAPDTVRYNREVPDLGDPVFDVSGLSIYYGSNKAVRDVDLKVGPRQITAMIGPSGCGKSTVLRTLNRMNDLIPGARIEGKVTYHGEDLYASEVDPIEVRRRIGMVFQKPNPFPKSIYDNVAYGPKINGVRGNMDDLVEEALRRVLVGVTGVVVAHRASTVLLADRVALLQDGTITHVGTHTELLETVPAYRALLSAESEPSDELLEVAS